MDSGTAASDLEDKDVKNLEALLDAFGSSVSLEDMASAYCDAGRDLQAAAEILCSRNETVSGSSMPVTQKRSEQPAPAVISESHSGSSGRIPHNAKWKAKKSSASAGTVSSVIGKDYLIRIPQSVVTMEKAEPVKLRVDEIASSEIWDEKNDSGSSSLAEPMEPNVGEFLCKMLADAFHLEKSVIQEVIGQCGYNMPMSIDKLLNLTVGTLENNGDIISSDMQNNSLDQETSTPNTTNPCADLKSHSEGVVEPHGEAEQKNIQKEVLDALFTVPERVDKKQVRIPKRPKSRATYGEIVSKPLEVEVITDFNFITRSPVKRRDHDVNESSYDDLRKAVKEYWGLMKDYLKAGADAFTNKEYERAQKLMETGAFYMRKAREADEKSAQKLIHDGGNEEEFSVNMHYIEPKNAVDLLKILLTNLAGLPYVRNMTIVTGTDTESKQDRRRKRAITRLLEEEEIPWTTDGNDWTLLIRLENVDLKKLSFAK